ncbi:uncharacterized protein B0I36DRAFT_321114 [Microdochium trichocladiopsis]|uniref:Uncharacterized protein n=1 Tax=Microdochium trichocladiopsis TaxID=1682393 RepID=A0A9P9BPM1_9PEZI|nr:uncharacterized protein B0I36DRAFT_321114 [Microdochium trichocladiopsis]KAH7033279.1 hypothetical protein B0I36DRAFT_321114 [Microdochium trichocladiopsis]
MMQSTFGLPMADRPPVSYPAVSTPDQTLQYIPYMETVSRLPRASSVQRPTGAMRVVKPSSTSSSPQARAARRRTMMADTNIARRRGQPLDHNTIHQHFQHSPYVSASVEEPIKRTSRPLSWHPGSSSQAQQQQQYTAKLQQQLEQQQHLLHQNGLYQNTYTQRQTGSTYTVPSTSGYLEEDHYTRFQNMPPTPIQFSAQNSPISGYIPSDFTSINPAEGNGSPSHYFAPAIWSQTQPYTDATGYEASPEALESFPPLPVTSTSTWDQPSQPERFYGGITPPTPQDTQSSQHHEAVAVTPEESIPYEPLQASEDEGEILVGMGLYEDPEKTEDDPWLDNYRITTSELLGTTYRRVGQGLKLEESWEPPASDDENDGDDSSSDRDADGEEQDTAASPEETQTWI